MNVLTGADARGLRTQNRVAIERLKNAMKALDESVAASAVVIGGCLPFVHTIGWKGRKPDD